MILINLLPHREAARKQRREAFFVSLGIAAVFGAVVATGIYFWLDAQINSQRDKNAFLQAEIKRLDVQIKDIATLQQEIAALRARQEAVEDLQSDRNLPVHLLEEIVRQMPPGVYIIDMRQENLLITVRGVAQSNERIAEFLRNLGHNTPWFTKPELVEIVASSVSLGPRDLRKVANFVIRVQMQRASAVSASAAAAPASPVVGQGARTASAPALAASPTASVALTTASGAAAAASAAKPN